MERSKWVSDREIKGEGRDNWREIKQKREVKKGRINEERMKTEAK